jgi:hypothetical protein
MRRIFAALTAATTLGPGESHDLGKPRARHTLIVTVEAGTAGVGVEFSHDGETWTNAQIGPIAATSDTAVGLAASRYYEFVARYVRANVTALAGGATVSATIASA